MKYFFIIISFLLNMMVCDNKIYIENNHTNSNNIESILENSPLEDLLWDISNNEILDGFHSRNEKITLNFKISKTNIDIDRVSIMTNNCCGTIDHGVSGALFFFNENANVNFSLTINAVGLNNSQLSIDLFPQKNSNGAITPANKKTINIYCMGEQSFYCMSTLSLTDARKKMYDHLISEGITTEEETSREYYIFQEQKNFTITQSNIDENSISIIDGNFNFQTETSDFYPAKGIKAKVCAYDNNNGIIYYDETFTDSNGYFSLNLMNETYSSLKLVFLAETKYVNVYSGFNNESGDVDYSSKYTYEIDLTNYGVISFGKKYTVENVCTCFYNDRGKAFASAIVINSGGDFFSSFVYEIENVKLVYPASGSAYSRSLKTISLDGYCHEKLLHEYGHHACFALGVNQVMGGFSHTREEDLALRYPDSDGVGVGRGYQAAWGEGFAFFFSNLVQSYYDYSFLSETWGQEYINFKNQVLDDVDFVLRESNENTVTCVLLALCDSDFLFKNAIGIEKFFEILKDYSDNINSLSDFLNLLKNRIDVDKELLKQVTIYYRLSPYELEMTNTIGNDNVVSNTEIPKFSWRKGNYHIEKEYLMYADNGNGERYTEDDAQQNSSVLKTNYGLSNANFVLYIYDYNGKLLLKEDNISQTVIAYRKCYYTPTQNMWESIFYEASTLQCFWFVEGRDINVNDSYVYRSETSNFTLEKRYIEHKTSSISTTNSELEVDFTVEETINSSKDFRDFSINLSYCWKTIPEQRYNDYIIMSWNAIYQLNGKFYTVSYYNNNQEILINNYYSENHYKTSIGINQLYWEVNMLWFDDDNKPPYALYGEAEVCLTAPFTVSDLYVKIEYHHITNTASAMNGVFEDEDNNNLYTTLSDFKTIVYKTYSF